MCFCQLVLIGLHIYSSNLFIFLLMCAFIPLNFLCLKGDLNFKLAIFSFVICVLLGMAGILGYAELNTVATGILAGFNTLLLSINSCRKSFIKYSLIFLYGFNLIILYLAFKNNFDPLFGNEIFFNKSRNYVSGTLALFSIYYLALCKRFEVQISLLVLLILLLNSILLYDRSGVLVAFLILLYGIYQKFGRIIFLGTLSIGIIFFSMIFLILQDFTNFSEGLDTPRTLLLTEYLSSLGKNYYLIFGADLKNCCGVIQYYGYNPHNSFLMSHSIFGIVTIVPISIILWSILSSRQSAMIFLCLIILIRFWLDSMGLYTYYDLALYTIFYCCYSSKVFNNFDTKNTIFKN